MTSTTDKNLKYETTGDMKPKKSGIKTIDQMSTTRIVLHLINRHKVALLFLWAVIATALALAPSLVVGIIKSVM